MVTLWPVDPQAPLFIRSLMSDGGPVLSGVYYSRIVPGGGVSVKIVSS